MKYLLVLSVLVLSTFTLMPDVHPRRGQRCGYAGPVMERPANCQFGLPSRGNGRGPVVVGPCSKQNRRRGGNNGRKWGMKMRRRGGNNGKKWGMKMKKRGGNNGKRNYGRRRRGNNGRRGRGRRPRVPCAQPQPHPEPQVYIGSSEEDSA